MKEERKQFLDWVIYQIYPRSFKDTNGDGFGDLNGITEKLDYLCELGINAIWISPCYKSPNYDNGYDISDYRDIMEDFGTFEDWQNLVKEMHARGMKLIMDLVVNHTSSEHYWFQEARKSRDNPYHDYYVWADKPLNNWMACFGGSMWEYNEPTNEYYLHSFAVQQPDLNWENPKVRQECCDIVDFWVNLGVDGFRCDVLERISKDFVTDKFYKGPRLHEYINQMFGRENVSHIFTVGECDSNEEDIVDICGENRGELTTVFQFDHIMFGRLDKYTPAPFEYDQIKDILVKWQNFTIKNDLLYMLFTDNHDQPFYISRLGNDKELRYECATMYATMFYLLKGIPLVYQGQEFGTTNSYYTDIAEFDDIETRNYYYAFEGKMPQETLIEKINYGSRDNPRRPIAWTADEATCYGFSNGKSWLKPCTRAKEINLETDRNSKKSIFEFYKKLLAFRKGNPAIILGEFTDLTKGFGYFMYQRSMGEKEVIVICNFKEEQDILLPASIREYRYVLGNYIDGKPYAQKFRPFEIAVYEKN